MSSHAPIALAGLVVAAALACATALPPAAAGATVTAKDGAVELLECGRGKRVADRSALFRAEMRQVAGGDAMRMRFGLRERVGRGPWRAVKAPGLGVWRNARPDVSRFAYRQRIAALARGTAYRVRVEFQWHDTAGVPIDRQAAISPVCRQRGPLPDLGVAALERLPGPTPETARYVTWIVNRGAASAPRSEVALRIDGAEVDTYGMGRIAAGGRRQVAFVGPACMTEATVEADSTEVVRESNERDNLRSFDCGVSE
ncbi:MAG TPA: CARDB domain-containing protein [Thermoleophilaceae bacterium]|nr:CARDB domain-containing protein [Thermoleophilaceae bacterium]